MALTYEIHIVQGLLAHTIRVYCSRAHTHTLLVIHQNRNWPTQRGWTGNAFLQIKENSIRCLQAFAQINSDWPCRLNQVRLLCFWYFHLWVKLKPDVGRADTGSRGGQNLRANNKTRPSWFSSLEKDAGLQWASLAHYRTEWHVSVTLDNPLRWQKTNQPPPATRSLINPLGRTDWGVKKTSQRMMTVLFFLIAHL